MASRSRPEPKRILIFDTTLRDGEQSPGATMTSEEKLEVASALSGLGVDIIEAGFPASSRGEWEAVRRIAGKVGNASGSSRYRAEPPVICALARATERDIEAAWTAVCDAARPRIHTFIATSPVHRRGKLRMSRHQVLESIAHAVRFARELCADVEFSPEDAGRTESGFLHEAVRTAIEAGATTVNLPDTVGSLQPGEVREMIAGIKQRVDGAGRVTLSVHCHNDLGLATANTLAGLEAGARQAELTVNGVGERAGIAALEECVLALCARQDRYGLFTGIDTTKIAGVSRLVSSVSGILVQPNKAIVGANAFTRGPDMLVDETPGVEQPYEVIRPETVGAREPQLVFGKQSCRRAAFATRLAGLGCALGDAALDRVFHRFQDLADRKGIVTDAELVALATDEVGQPELTYFIDEVTVACSADARTATVALRDAADNIEVRTATGNGSVEAVFTAIDAIVNVKSRLVDFRLRAATGGKTALGEATVKIQAEHDALGRNHPQSGQVQPRVFHGHGANLDVIEASAHAYVSAINKLIAATGMRRGSSERLPVNRDILINGVDAGAPPEGAALWDAGSKRAG